jgi:integrase
VTNLKVHVIPALGALKLQRLTAPRLAAFYSELLASGRRDGKGLAPKTVRNIHALLHRALKDAARWGYVAHNRADDVDPPHGGSPQQQVWTPEQLRAFLTHVRGDRLYALWLLVATTGMRRAELADSNDLVFTWPDGRPLHPDLITDWFQRHARRVVWDQDGRKRVGLPAIRLHDVRHSYATAALAAGIPAKIVSERLGHANVQITLDTYSHVIPGLDEQAAATVARLILEGSGAGSPGSPGGGAANSAAKTGDAPHSREEVRGEVPGELGGGGGI